MDDNVHSGSGSDAMSLTDKRLGPRSTLTRSSVAPPSLSISTLTTRSSSTTRLAQLATQNARDDAGEAYRRPWPSRTHSHDRQPSYTCGDKAPLLIESNHSTAPRGRSGRKAVAFELGRHAPSSAEQDNDLGAQGRQIAYSSKGDSPFESSGFFSWPSIDDIIDAQVHQRVVTIKSRNPDPLLRYGISDYSFVLGREHTRGASSSVRSEDNVSSSSTPAAGEKDSEPPPHPDRVSLGKGKFSEVLLVRKGITDVYETIRTPGHFYLVEESLRSSVTLEAFVTSFENHRVPLNQAWSILEQLASVVRSLHEPLRVCHRDIKPENILVKVEWKTAASDKSPTVSLKLLDFGLATHFSASEPKLTTCCGSPAYHAPELWRSLREPSGTVKYWGPEVDVWCVGLTLLRCLTPNTYPLGIAHSSLKALGDKVIDSLLGIEDDTMRQTLAGFLHMDGATRMEAFKAYCETDAVRRRSSFGDSGFGSDIEPISPNAYTSRSPSSGAKKHFKSTTFIPTKPAFVLELPIASSSDLPPGPPPLEVCPEKETPIVLSRSSSRARLASSSVEDIAKASCDASPESPAPDLTSDMCSPEALNSAPTTPSTPFYDPFYSSLPPPIQIVLSNPADETIERATSFIKYALRCAGILYHVRARDLRSANGSHASLPSLARGPDFENCVTYLECVLTLPHEQDESMASSALKAALRPPLLRAHTMGSVTRSSSTPPERNKASVETASSKDVGVRATTFFMRVSKGQYVAGALQSNHASPHAGGNTNRRSKRRSERDVFITLSDERALQTVKNALSFDYESCRHSNDTTTPHPETDQRGRHVRTIGNGRIGLEQSRDRSQPRIARPASLSRRSTRTGPGVIGVSGENYWIP
ncbi:hypothetical protein OIV83_004242 [Microbotryomycetes sp. JL201]|nr:hypothetical protein OIV83_004242 [Microbotryomycetes sp. JL201]